MTEPVQESAVLDRFEGDVAVLIVEPGGLAIDIPRSALPAGARAGVWLVIVRRGDDLVSVAIDHDATAAARARIDEKLARLRRGDHLR